MTLANLLKKPSKRIAFLFLEGSAFFEINQNGEIYYQCLREFKDYDFKVIVQYAITDVLCVK